MKDASRIDIDRIVEAALRARPEASLPEVRLLVPLLSDVPDNEVEQRIARVRRRLAGGRQG